MNVKLTTIAQRGTGCLAQLRGDRAGTTLAMMAIGIVPLAGLVGGAVDMSRLYLTKTRLQQACDAGALAGRKVMGGGTWANKSFAARTSAEQFFDGNFQNGDYGTSERVRTFTEVSGKVSGVASARVPMTLMKIFKKGDTKITVNCDAELRLPNTDIMFVLDTTGSMDCDSDGNNCGSAGQNAKIVGLRKSVKCFYEIVARLDTDAACDSGPGPTGGTGNQVQIRFGFVPYATNVNVGKLLPTAWFADSWQYQTRRKETTTETYYEDGTPSTDIGSNERKSIQYTSWGNATNQTVSLDNCRNNEPQDTELVSRGSETLIDDDDDDYDDEENDVDYDDDSRTVTYQTRQPYQYFEYRYIYNNGNCRYESRRVRFNLIRSYTREDAERTRQVFRQWRYAPYTENVSALKNGMGWNDSMTLPIGNGGVDKTIEWDGCIEERATVRQANYSPIPADAEDLDIDTAPNPGDPRSLWGPALPSVIYARRVVDNWNQMNATPITTTANYYNNVPYFCPTEARKLQKWPTASDFQSYVNGLQPSGNTFHDIGMIWGARFVSPNGMFRSENEFTPQGGEIERHLIFMTDGDTVANNTDYGPYGFPWFDRRTTDAGAAPSSGQLVSQVDARFAAVCTAVKNKNITLWVVAFGNGTNAATNARMSSCATPGRYFLATDSDKLIATFKSIADQISQLRLTK